MKKQGIIFALLGALMLSLAGCRGSDGEELKLYRIEITDLTGAQEPVVLEGLTQTDMNGFLYEGDWENTETVDPSGLVPQYHIEIYQDATQTVLGEDAPEPLKILEYVTYQDTDLVKCTIGADFLPKQLVEGFLEIYDTAPQSFFTALHEALTA